MNTFSESQHFRQGWVWILMGFTVLIFVGSLSTVGAYNDPVGWLGTVLMLMVVGLMYCWRLDTRHDINGVHYRVFPVLGWRTIPWNRVRMAAVCQYGFVGYGIRWGFDGWVYNIAGDKGLRIMDAKGRQITIGTQRSDEIQHFLDRQPICSK